MSASAPNTDPRLAAFLDRAEILEVLMRYGRGVDRAVEEWLKSCYHPDAIAEHGNAYVGPAFDWNHDIPGSEGWCLGMFNLDHPAMHFGRKDREDLSYQRF